MTDSNACEDINECTTDTDDCDANAACANTAGSHTCTCDPGYHGTGESCTAYEGECANGDLIALTSSINRIDLNRISRFDHIHILITIV